MIAFLFHLKYQNYILLKDKSKLYAKRIVRKESRFICSVAKQRWNIGQVTSFAQLYLVAMATNKSEAALKVF